MGPALDRLAGQGRVADQPFLVLADINAVIAMAHGVDQDVECRARRQVDRRGLFGETAVEHGLRTA